jgi:hypothetical protein
MRANFWLWSAIRGRKEEAGLAFDHRPNFDGTSSRPALCNDKGGSVVGHLNYGITAHGLFGFDEGSRLSAGIRSTAWVNSLSM